MKRILSRSGKNNPMYGKVPWNKGKHIWKDRSHPRGMLGKIPWNKNKHMWKDREHPRGMLGKRGRRCWSSGLTKESDIRIKKMTEKTGKTLKKLYQSGKLKPYMLGRKHSEETKRKISETEKRLYKEGKIIPPWLGKKKPEVAIRNREMWKNRENREKIIKKLIVASRNRPTSLEKQMIEIIGKYNLPYEYVGDGSFLIGYKNPDFISVNGDKICIEVANKFHHPNPWEHDRIKHFARYGWKCLVFFEEGKRNRLNEEEIIKNLCS